MLGARQIRGDVPVLPCMKRMRHRELKELGRLWEMRASLADSLAREAYDFDRAEAAHWSTVAEVCGVAALAALAAARFEVTEWEAEQTLRAQSAIYYTSLRSAVVNGWSLHKFESVTEVALRISLE